MNHGYIYYLVYSLEKVGYVLPSELSEDEWQLNGYGVFALPTMEQKKSIQLDYHIKAIMRGEEIDIRMHLSSGNEDVCYAELPNRERVFFKMQWNHRLRYVGDKQIKRFAVLTPQDITRLEELCLEQKFFFVGYDLA